MAKPISPLKTIKGLEAEYGLKPGALRFIFLEVGDGSVGHRDLTQRLARRFKLPNQKAGRLVNHLVFGKFVVLDAERSNLTEGIRNAFEVMEARGKGRLAPERPDTTFYKLGYKTRQYCKLKRLPVPPSEKTYVVAQHFHISFEIKARNKNQAKKIEEGISDRIYEAMTDLATSAGGLDTLEGSSSAVFERKGKWWSGHEDLEAIGHRLSVERFRREEKI